MAYDKKIYEFELKRLQESRRTPASGTEPEQYHSGTKNLEDNDRRNVARLFSGFLERLRQNGPEGSERSSRWIGFRTNLTARNNLFGISEVDSKTFHDIFEINRNLLKHGELVDLHENYSNCKCFLADDGLAGFAIEPNGNLISVFSQYGDNKRGFLHAIKSFVTEQGATHCDCYDSKLQPLPSIYEKTLGWQEASRMKYNLAYDHDNIAKNHGMPDIAFMVHSNRKVEKRAFNENQFEEASSWQQKALKSELSASCNKNEKEKKTHKIRR